MSVLMIPLKVIVTRFERTARMERGCEVCGGFVEDYMVEDSTWALMFDKDDVLCLNCLYIRFPSLCIGDFIFLDKASGRA